MKREYKISVIKIICIIYAICFLFRSIEYMFIRTDQSILGEAFIHKLIGIFILSVALKVLSMRWKEIGFNTRHIVRYLAYGILLGLAAFIVAYSAEIWLNYKSNDVPFIQAYVTSYSINGNLGNTTSLIFFVICILGNLINVIMEEGIFRGLFLRLAERECTFFGAVAVSSILFGVWHIIAPLRSFLDGNISAKGMLITGIVLFITSTLAGIKFCLLTKITGSLWMPMADHFVNNTIVNLVHVVTSSGADELLVMRITMAQTISFLIVGLIYIKSRAWDKKTFR